MDFTGRDEPGSPSEKRSTSRAMPLEGCAEWFEKMREWFESRGGEMGCCQGMGSTLRDEEGAEKGEA